MNHCNELPKIALNRDRCLHGVKLSEFIGLSADVERQPLVCLFGILPETIIKKTKAHFVVMNTDFACCLFQKRRYGVA